MSRAPWTIADAKSRLSEVLNLAEQEAQIITRRSREFVVVDGDAYRRLTGALPTLKDVLLRGPGLEGVDLTRDRSGDRELNL
jgi:prevent-host-death family protein